MIETLLTFFEAIKPILFGDGSVQSAWIPVALGALGAASSLAGLFGKKPEAPRFSSIDPMDIYNRSVDIQRNNIRGSQALERELDPTMAAMRDMASFNAANLMGRGDFSNADAALASYQQSLNRPQDRLTFNPLQESGILSEANRLAIGNIGSESQIGIQNPLPSRVNLGAASGNFGAGQGIPTGGFGAMQSAPTVNFGSVSGGSVSPTVGGDMNFNPLMESGMDLDFGAGEDPEVDAKLSREIQNLVARQSGAAAAGAGLTGGQAGRDIVARDLGITALDLQRQRQQDARAFQNQQFGQRIAQQQQRLAQQGQGFGQRLAQGQLNTQRQGMAFDQGMANAQLGQQAQMANLDAQMRAADMNRAWNQQAFNQRMAEADYGRMAQNQAFNQMMGANQQAFGQRATQANLDLARQQQAFGQDVTRNEIGNRNIMNLASLGQYQQGLMADQQRLGLDVQRQNLDLASRQRAEQLGLADMLNRNTYRDLTTALGYVAGTPLPEYGLSAQDVMNMEIANMNAQNQNAVNAAQIAAGNANARTQMWGGLGSALLGMAGNMYGQGGSSTPSTNQGSTPLTNQGFQYGATQFPSFYGTGTITGSLFPKG